MFTVGVSLLKPKLSFETFGEKREMLIHVEVCIDSMLMILLLSHSVDLRSVHLLDSRDVNISYPTRDPLAHSVVNADEVIYYYVHI